MKTSTPTERLTKAKIQLLLHAPFYGTLATRLTCVLSDEIDTAETDGKVILWNKEFLASLSDAEVQGVYCHEILHVANGHLWRKGNREHERFNVAADLSINQIIKDSGLTLPKEALWPNAQQVGKSMEAIYAMLPESKKKGGGGGGDGIPGQPGPQGKDGKPLPGKDPGRCGGIIDVKATAEQIKQLEEEWKIAVTQAVMVAKSQGKMPGALEKYINELVNPKLPWHILLRDFVQRSAKNDYNWTVPNRRYLQSGFVLPTLISDELPEIVLVIDTSGSMGQKELDQAAAELTGILGDFDTTIHVLHTDTRVAHVEVLTRADLPLKLKMRGGGGTDLRSSFQYVQEHDLTPACMILVTDMYTPFPDKAPDYPVLWAASTDIKGPFGETVRL